MNADNADLLMSSDQTVIVRELNESLDESFAEMRDDQTPSNTFFGLSASTALSTNDDLEAAAKNAPRLMDVRIALQDKPLEELAASAQVQNAKGIVRQSSHVKAARNQEAQNYKQEIFEDLAQSDRAEKVAQNYGTADPARQARREAYAQHIQNQLDLGASMDDIRFQLNNRKIWDTFTPHPTKDKNNAAQNNVTNLIKSGAKTAFGVLNEIAKNPLSPRIKDSLTDETNTGLDVLDTYIEGGLDYLEDMQWALDNRFEENDIAPEDRFDLIDLGIDIAPRDWYAGDADGKLVPAEVLFSKRLQGAHRGVEKYLQIFKSVPEEQREALSDTIQKFESLSYRLGKIDAEMEKQIAEALAEFEIELSSEDWKNVSPEEKEKALKLEVTKIKGAALKAGTESFSKAFSDRGFNGLGDDIGESWTGTVMQKMREISEDENIPASARQAAKRAALMHKQVGMSLGRQEVRHSGEDFDKIFQNAFEYLAENPELAGDIKIKKGAKLTDLLSEQKIQFYKDFINLEGRRNLLEKANEGKLEGPAAEVLKRFDVLHDTFNQRRMGVAIIAEANEMSCIQQQILAEAYHINGMTHCALNEDQETIKMAAGNLRTYLTEFGHNNLQIKLQEVEGEEGHPDVYVAVMDPASDSQKSWGPFMKGAQLKSAGEVAKLGMDFNIAALGKIGTGMSYARGGFPAVMSPRLLMHAVTKIMDVKDLGDDMRQILKKQLSFASVTIQGRGPNLLRGSREQVQDALAKIGFEMDLVSLAVDGHIEPKEVVPMAPKYSAAMSEFLDNATQDARDNYFNFIRKEPSEIYGEKVENVHTKSVSATIMALLTNVSARKASRDDGDSKVELVKDKDTGGQRAIGQNVVKEWSETLYDGWYEIGTFLSSAREAVNDKTITRAQIAKLQKDQSFTRHRWGNAVLALSKADFEWGFDKIALDKGEYSDERWTVGKLLTAQENGFDDMDEAEKRQAQIAYEGIVASSHFESFFENFQGERSERDVILSLYKENDTLDKVKFGSKTKAFYPAINPTQKLAQEDRLARAMVHEGERRLREKEARGEHLEEGSLETQKYRHIAMTRRAASGPITLPNLMDTPDVTFGARKGNVIDFLSKKLEPFRRASNDNTFGMDEGPAVSIPA